VPTLISVHLLARSAASVADIARWAINYRSRQGQHFVRSRMTAVRSGLAAIESANGTGQAKLFGGSDLCRAEGTGSRLVRVDGLNAIISSPRPCSLGSINAGPVIAAAAVVIASLNSLITHGHVSVFVQETRRDVRRVGAS
jgi:hypothetical protein